MASKKSVGSKQASSAKEHLKQEIKACGDEAVRILLWLQDKKRDNKYSFHHHYQEWYSKALRVVKVLGPDRYDEFKRYYEIDPKRKSIGYGTYVIQDYIKGVGPRISDFNAENQVLTCLHNQNTILLSLTNRIDSALADIEATLLSEIQDLEIDTAERLLKVNLRAAGVIAGVLLEDHLKRVTQARDLSIKGTPGITKYNEALKAGNAYDVSTWRKISYLGDVRNLCAHKSTQEPTEEQTKDLVQGVRWVIKNIS